MLLFWFVAGFAIRSWWVLLGPVTVAIAVLIGLEVVPDFDDRRIGEWLLYLGGDFEFWWTTYLFGAPFFMLAAGLGLQLRRHVDRKRTARALT